MMPFKSTELRQSSVWAVRPRFDTSYDEVETPANQNQIRVPISQNKKLHIFRSETQKHLIPFNHTENSNNSIPNNQSSSNEKK